MQPFITIGGTAGSGTRTLCKICIDSGIFMGSNLGTESDPSYDAMNFFPFFWKYVNIWLYEKLFPLTLEKENEMIRDFHESAKRHLKEMSSSNHKWGHKSALSIHLLSFFHKKFPDMKFIHVIRDGRDMAYTKNGLNDLERHGFQFLKKEIKSPLDILNVWSIVNLNAAIYGASNMKDNYLQVKFEDLCFNPQRLIPQIYDFLDIKDMDINKTLEWLTIPNSIGRWKEHSDEMENMTKLDYMALEFFGYI